MPCPDAAVRPQVPVPMQLGFTSQHVPLYSGHHHLPLCGAPSHMQPCQMFGSGPHFAGTCQVSLPLDGAVVRALRAVGSQIRSLLDGVWGRSGEC